VIVQADVSVLACPVHPACLPDPLSPNLLLDFPVAPSPAPPLASVPTPSHYNLKQPPHPDMASTTRQDSVYMAKVCVWDAWLVRCSGWLSLLVYLPACLRVGSTFQFKLLREHTARPYTTTAC